MKKPHPFFRVWCGFVPVVPEKRICGNPISEHRYHKVGSSSCHSQANVSCSLEPLHPSFRFGCSFSLWQGYRFIPACLEISPRKMYCNARIAKSNFLHQLHFQPLYCVTRRIVCGGGRVNWICRIVGTWSRYPGQATGSKNLGFICHDFRNTRLHN